MFCKKYLSFSNSDEKTPRHVPVERPVETLQVVDGATLAAEDLGAARQDGRMGAMLTADTHEGRVVVFQQFQQDVVDGRVGVAGQQHRLAQFDDHAHQGDDQRRLAGAGQTVDEAVVVAGQRLQHGFPLQFVEFGQNRPADLGHGLGETCLEDGRTPVDHQLAQFGRPAVVGHQSAQVRVEHGLTALVFQPVHVQQLRTSPKPKSSFAEDRLE